MWQKVDCVIIGSGPAGCSAAVYLGNSGINNAVLLAGNQPGGLLTTTDYVVNYPGYKNIGGYELTEKLMEHAQEYVPIEYKHCQKIITKDGKKYIYTEENSGYITDYVIISTGSSPRKLNIEGEKQYANKGVSYCAICDGMFFKNKIIGIIGGGDKAVEEAVYLSAIGKEVHLFLRGNSFRAKEINTQQLNKDNIFIHYNHKAVNIYGDDHMQGVEFDNLGKKITYPMQGLFIAIGQIPNVQFLEDQIQLKDQYILVDQDYQTSIPGIFACGDVIYRNHSIKQAITSAAEGCISALNVSANIKNNQ